MMWPFIYGLSTNHRVKTINRIRKVTIGFIYLKSDFSFLLGDEGATLKGGTLMTAEI